MLTASVPTRQELVARASDLVPALAGHALRSEENRRLSDETVRALADAGMFRMRTPLRYGGYECDTRTLVDVATQLARGDGSVAWVVSVYWIPTWMVGLFPEQAQDDVFATPDVRVCGTLSPGGTATPVDGGVTLTGRWSFISGAWHSHWQQVVAVSIGTDQQPRPVMALVPMSDLQLVDDWYTAGLKGTGSVTTTATDVFVPAHRVLPLGTVLEGEPASAASRTYRVPLLPVAAASSVGTVVGLARAAQQLFLDRLPGRKITYTTYERQAEAPITHHRLAAAVLKADEAQFHAERLAALVDTKCADSTQWTVLERARARADMGACCRLGKECVEILDGASGGSSIYLDVAIQRIQRDVQAVSLHALMNPDTNDELYGRVLCGLPPNTLYI